MKVALLKKKKKKKKKNTRKNSQHFFIIVELTNLPPLIFHINKCEKFCQIFVSIDFLKEKYIWFMLISKKYFFKTR